MAWGFVDVMSEFGIGNDLIKILKSLYESVKSAVLLKNQIGTKFDTTVGDKAAYYRQFYLIYF